LIDALFDIYVAIRCKPNKATASQFCMQSARNTLTELHRLAACQCKGQADHDAVIGINRIEIGIVGEADRNTQLMQLINGGERFSVIATKAFSILNSNMRELPAACIFQQPLITVAVRCAPTHRIRIFSD